MTTDSNERESNRPRGDEYGGFVFDDEQSGSGHADSSSSLEQRLAPIVAFLVIVSLTLTGSYLAVTTLSGPSGDVLGSTGGSGTTAASDGPTGTPRANNGTTKTPPTTATARDSTSTDRTATPTAATDESGADVGTTRTPDRSPSIDDFSTISEQSKDGPGETVTVMWSVSDPDGDLETVRIRVVPNPNGNATIVERRTIAVNGSQADGETVLELENIAPGDAYELQLETEDRTGNVAVVVTRKVATE